MKPPTLEQWRQWAKTAARNWTDEPPGTNTAAKRAADANASAAHNGREPPAPRRRKARKPK